MWRRTRLVVIVIANLTGYFRPVDLYERWLGVLAQRDDNWSKQAYGELLFLYYARGLSAWADAGIAAALAAKKLQGDTSENTQAVRCAVIECRRTI